ncbi:hypothetical protein, partial [Stenotrophomonas maltophilia]|uniref:hypothetical protein n=1 Tax=Stenotrophomonas maltophilia TaxID=40324 RepID=UPI001C60AA21
IWRSSREAIHATSHVQTGSFQSAKTPTVNNLQPELQNQLFCNGFEADSVRNFQTEFSLDETSTPLPPHHQDHRTMPDLSSIPITRWPAVQRGLRIPARSA